MNHYKTSVTINQIKPVVFKAISEQLGSWWGEQSQPISAEGDEFTVSWGEPWYKFKVIKYRSNLDLIWECVDANQIIAGLEGVQKEWVGTQIHWRLKEADNKQTLLEFEHLGLVPDFICYDFCTKTWEHFLKDSLVNYLK